MADLEAYLNRWLAAGVIEEPVSARIRAFEYDQRKPTGLRWQGLVALILGAILLACGVVLFVSAHWDELGPLPRFLLVLGMVTVFHVGGALTRGGFKGLSTTLHAVGTVAVGAAIALVGQIFNIQEHWPAAILMWAIAAAVGWALLRDEAQQMLAMLLFPAWMICEWWYQAQNYIGDNVYIGRILFTWGALYLTLFLGSRRNAVHGISVAVGAIAALVGTEMMLSSWRSWFTMATFLPLDIRVWGWVIIAVVPVASALFKMRASLVPVCVSLCLGLALPWCNRSLWVPRNVQVFRTYSDEPTLLGYILVAAFTIFIIWWGVGHASRALVNLGILGFAIDVGFFYSNDIFNKVGRSLGLMGLGVLFLAGGWLLEKTRRRLIAGMHNATTAPAAASGEAL